MRLKFVVCRVDEGEGTVEQLINLDPESFISMLDDATKQGGGADDDLAALEAEMGRAKAAAAVPLSPAAPHAPVPAALPADVMVSGDGKMILLPRAAVEPLVQAKTRGELIEKLNELLSPFGIQIAGA